MVQSQADAYGSQVTKSSQYEVSNHPPHYTTTYEPASINSHDGSVMLLVFQLSIVISKSNLLDTKDNTHDCKLAHQLDSGKVYTEQLRSSHYPSHYNKEASECIKNAVCFHY